MKYIFLFQEIKTHAASLSASTDDLNKLWTIGVSWTESHQLWFFYFPYNSEKLSEGRWQLLSASHSFV